MDIYLAEAYVRVFDATDNLLFQGFGDEVPDWIVENPLHPSYVLINLVDDPVSIDEYLLEWDRQSEE